MVAPPPVVPPVQPGEAMDFDEVIPGMPVEPGTTSPLEPPVAVPPAAVPPAFPTDNSGAEMPEPFPEPPVAQKEPGEPQTTKSQVVEPQLVEPLLPESLSPEVADVPTDVTEPPAGGVDSGVDEAPQLLELPALSAAEELSGPQQIADPNSSVSAAPNAMAVSDSAGPGLPHVSADGPSLGEQATTPLQANWMAALHAGFRGDARQMVDTYPKTRPVPKTRPAQPLTSQAVAPKYQRATPSGPVAANAQHEQQRQQPPAAPVTQATVNAQYTPPKEEPPVAPLALDGFCPVELVANERWVAGDPRLTAEYQGRTYRLSNPLAHQHFLADPGRFAPMYDGFDPVLVVETRRQAAGKTEFCVTYAGRLYMFSSLATLTRFQNNPQGYVPVEGR